MRNLKVIGKALVDVYDNMFVLLLVNLVWSLLALLPVSAIISAIDTGAREPESAAGVPVILFLIGLLLVALTSPASYAIAVLMRRVSEYEAISPREYFRLMLQHCRRAWVMGFMSLAGTALLLVNLSFYSNMGGWAIVLLPFFLMITVYWFIMQLYLFPLAVITDGGPLRVLRNAAIIVIRHPGLSLATSLAAVILLAISAVLVIPWLIVTMGAVTALGSRAVRVAVRRDFGLPDEDPIIDEPLPPIGADEFGRPPLPHYGWRAGRREAGDEAALATEELAAAEQDEGNRQEAKDAKKTPS